MYDKVQLIKEEIERRMNISIEQGYTISAAQLKRVIDFINTLPEEPGYEANFTTKDEDLEEYAKKLTKGAALDKHNLIWMCKKGAEWQKQQMKEVLQTEYEKGRFDMREEMMKDSVHAWVNTYESVTNPYDNRVSFITILSPSKFKNKETVQIIIVKED